MQQRTHRKITAAAAALALGFTGVACNDDDNGTDDTTTTVAPGVDDGTMDDGTMDDGTMDDGTMDDGTMDNTG